jgi:hypothetical protein
MTAPLLAFGRPVLQTFDFQSAKTGMKMGLACLETVTLALWLCITKSRTRTSWNFLYVMFLPQDLRIRKAFSMVMSEM